jgi:hypothetical protein
MSQTELSGSGTVTEVSLVASSPSDMFRRASDAHADRAVEMGILGYEITAQAYAQLADLCALLGALYSHVEMMRAMFP